MRNLIHRNYLWLLAGAALVLFSCSSPSFKVLDADVQNGVVMEGQYWRGFFDPKGGFGLRLTNNSNMVLNNCVISFDDKYRHSIEGLYSQEKGLIKDSTVKKGEQITLRFDDEISNILYFDVQEQNYFPKTITLKTDSFTMKWNFK